MQSSGFPCSISGLLTKNSPISKCKHLIWGSYTSGGMGLCQNRYVFTFSMTQNTANMLFWESCDMKSVDSYGLCVSTS